MVVGEEEEESEGSKATAAGGSVRSRHGTSSVRRVHVLPRPSLVPTVFRWRGEGSSVFVSGSFDGWATRIPLAKSSEDFATIIDIPPGTHEYKFIVDGTWQHATDQEARVHDDGNRNNVVVVKMTEVFSDEEWVNNSSGPHGLVSDEDDEDEAGFSQIEPEEEEAYAKPPRTAPPHLMRCILNTRQSKENPNTLPIPHHTQISHLYLQRSSIPNVQVMATTARFNRKFVTNVFYSPRAHHP